MSDLAILLEEFENAPTIEEREEKAWELFDRFGYDVYAEDEENAE